MGREDKEVLEARIAAGTKRERKEKLKEMRKELKKKKDGFFAEFKKFITRGNVLDMAVGVIVGGAFTAIINALSNNILKPVINWILALVLGKDSLSEVYTFLTRVDLADGSGPDLTQSIYIDWGAFINAVINFLLIAFTLFVIVRTINNIRKRLDAKELAEAAEKKAAEEAAKKEAEAAAAKAAADKAAAERAALEQMYANIARQTELLEQLAKK